MTTFSELERELTDCLKLAERLLELLAESSAALVRCDYARLNGLVAAQGELGLALRRGEESLRKRLAATAVELGQPASSAWPALVDRLRLQVGSTAAERLDELAQRLRKVAGQLSEETAINQALLRNLEEYTRTVFRLLLGAEERTGYGRKPPPVVAARHLVDREL